MYGEKILQTFGESGKSGKSSFTNLLLGNTECNSRQGVSRSKSMTELGVHNPEASKTSDKLNDKHECYDTFKYLDVDVRSHKKELRQIRKELLMKKNMFKQKTLTVNIAARDEANIQDLFDLIKSSFESSGIPPEEMPDIPVSPDIEYTANSDEIMQTITAIKGVIVCFNKRGMLQIYVHQSEGVEDIKEHIRVTLDRHNLKEYNISYGKSLPLAQCASGDSVCQAMGTLGGFVKKVALPTARVRDQRNVLPQDFAALSTNTNGVGNVANGSSSSDTHAPTTAALVSRHVVQRMDPPVLIVDSIQTPIGRIAGLPQITENDIFPIDVDEACKKLCDTRFKTELNESMYSKLRKSGDIRALRGKPVHIWGAKSTPGYGILVEHDARAVNELRINIRDRRTDEPFAQQGDSGAMVCYFDPRHEILYAVAMLINAVQLEGEETHRRYTAQILDDALQKLSIVNGCQFLLFEDETETSEYE